LCVFERVDNFSMQKLYKRICNFIVLKFIHTNVPHQLFGDLLRATISPNCIEWRSPNTFPTIWLVLVYCVDFFVLKWFWQKHTQYIQVYIYERASTITYLCIVWAHKIKDYRDILYIGTRIQPRNCPFFYTYSFVAKFFVIGKKIWIMITTVLRTLVAKTKNIYFVLVTNSP